MRAVTAVLLALTMTASLAPAPALAAGYGVSVNGRSVSDTLAELRNGQLAVAVRPFMEAMGGQVTWNASARQVTVSRQGTTVALWQGTTLAFKNGQRLTAPFAPYINGDKMMVPAWWLAAQFGATLRFDGGTLSVQIGGQSIGVQSSSPLMNRSFYFPFPQGAKYETYYAGMGDPRTFQGREFGHEGTDILSPKGTPIVAVASGTVVRYGWNTLGGYRVTVQLDSAPDYRFYYAHMDRYAPGIYQGAHVRAGQVLGYVGNTGEGPERTEGKFVTHLHFGIYSPDGTAIDPYPFLKFWEAHKAGL
jgi:murein DD-endopeptidase MepM/ murein hydrolase activator NlpD